MKKGDLPPITVTKDEDNDDIYNDDVDEKGFRSKGLWVTLQYDRLRNIEGWVSCRPHRNPIFWWSLWWEWASWWILKLARERIYDKNLIYWSESFRGEQWAMPGLIFLRINLFEAGWHFSDCPLTPQLPSSCPLKPSHCPLQRWNCSKSTALIKLKAWINKMWYIKPTKSDYIWPKGIVNNHQKGTQASEKTRSAC